MKTPENQFISSVHHHFPPMSQLHREKNHNTYRCGTADEWYSGNLDDLWIEYKYEPQFPVRDRFIIPNCSPRQVRWLRGRFTEGRNVLVIVGYPIGGVVYYNPVEWEERGIDLSTIQERLMSRKELAEYIIARIHINREQ
jgi:hypothetical protein